MGTPIVARIMLHLLVHLVGGRRAVTVDTARNTVEGTESRMRSLPRSTVALFVRATAEEVPIVVVAEPTTKDVQGERVDARIDEGQTETDDLEDVPEHVVESGIEMEPQEVRMTWKPAHDKDGDERQHDLGHLLACLHLAESLALGSSLGR